MAMARSPWRALRPVLLAGAATLSWLTFSSPAASADVLSDTASLLGGVATSVSPTAGGLAGPAPAAPSTPPAAPAVSAVPVAPSAGLLQPVVGQVSGLADNVVAAVPVVNQVVPAGAVTAVTVPVAGAADGATAAVVDVVVAPVAEAVPVLEPVLQPVTDLVTGTAPLPVTVPELPVLPVEADMSDGAGLSGTTAAVLIDAPDAPGEGQAPVGVPVGGAVGDAGPAASGGGAGALAGTSSPLRAPALEASVEAGQQDAGGPSPAPAPAPAVPGSGAGSGASSAGSAGAAAWLSPCSFDLPVPGAIRVGETAEHVPAPVSLDPGSSPD